MFVVKTGPPRALFEVKGCKKVETGQKRARVVKKRRENWLKKKRQNTRFFGYTKQPLRY